jgi:hypothetical protein
MIRNMGVQLEFVANWTKLVIESCVYYGWDGAEMHLAESVLV